MTTTNNITTTQQLSDYLFSKGVHHYLDTIKKPIVEKLHYKGLYDWSPMCSMNMTIGSEQKDIIEIPIAMIAANDGYRFFNALNVCLQLIESGIHLVKSNCNNFLYLTVRGNVVAENN